MKKIAVIFTIVLFIVPAAFAKEEQKQTSGTYQASCMIRIIANPEILEPGAAANNILSILQSSGVGARAAKDILGFKPEELTNDTLRDMIETEHFQNSSYSRNQRNTKYECIYTFGLKVAAQVDTKSAPIPAAEEFMGVLIDGLKLNLNRLFEDYKDRLNEQIRAADKNAEEEKEAFYMLQNQLREIYGSRDLSRKAIFSDINSLQQRIDDCRMSIVKSQIELDELPKQIERISRQIEDKLASDAALREMENMVKNQQQLVDEMKKGIEKGSFSAKDIAEAQEKLTRIRIELANRREDISRNSGGNRVDMINERIADLSSRINQSEGLMQYLHNQLNESKELLKKADEYEVLSIKADIAKRSLEESLQTLENLKRSDDLVPPTITIMGAGE